MCEVFSEVLGVDKVGIKDNFFELGGHSLKAIWLVKQLEVKTGHRISLDDVLKSPNVEMLASLLTDTSAEGAEKIKTAYQTLSQLVVRRNDPVILCFPFAGGFDSSFWKLSAELHRVLPKATVYSLKYANWTDVDFQIAIREISGIVEEANRVLIYSHCGGSGMAIKVFQNLPDKSKVEHLIIGASIPKKPKKRLEKLLAPKKMQSDESMKQYLTSIGFDWDAAPDDLQQDVLNQFRKDSQSCTKDIEELFGTVIKDLPCTVVVGDADPDIPVIEEVQPRWNRYFEKPVELFVLHGANHYFHKERVRELAEIIRRCNG